MGDTPTLAEAEASEVGTNSTGTTPKRKSSFAAVSMLMSEDTELMSGTSAAAKVFAVPELLEVILIEVGEVDMKSLFVLQRVDTAFHDIIERSRKLRRIMFMEGTNEESDTEPILNPLCFGESINRVLRPATLTKWVPNRVLQIHDPDSDSDGYKDEVRSILGLKCPRFLLCRLEVQSTAPASWQKLKLCHSATARGLYIFTFGIHGTARVLLYVETVAVEIGGQEDRLWKVTN